MCITFFHLFNPPTTNNHNKIRFLIAFNRDQDVNRETEQFKQFTNDNNIYAGRDVVSDGTWLGINIKTGIMVILTNYRLLRKRNAKSRGILVHKFLSSEYIQNPTSVAQLSNKIQQDMRQILKNPTQYSAFNISIYNIRHNKMFYMCSQIGMKQPIVLEDNITHGYSNTDINTNWNKVVIGKTMFNQQIITKFQNTKQIQSNNKNNSTIKQQQKIQEKGKHKKISHSQILGQMQKIMKNKQGLTWYNKYFQSTIFIPLYRSIYFNQRMTKSTFYAIFVQNQQGIIQAHIKQVTYNRNGTQSNVQLLLKI